MVENQYCKICLYRVGQGEIEKSSFEKLLKTLKIVLLQPLLWKQFNYKVLRIY